jgi:hypothetical protein
MPIKAYSFTYILVVSAMALLASCSRPAEAGIELTVYSHRHYEADQKL